MDHCRNLFSVCSMISELKERLTAVEGEIEELKKEPPTNPPPLAPGTFLIDSYIFSDHVCLFLFFYLYFWLS